MVINLHEIFNRCS